ncbi:hypothetical protein R1sor_010100 [Riccia sorocarpa]|uniref:Uncharacterized protein n=1 Tax=Riccia sorocarpa TaxID=122646 RepID=A0ABD3HZ00_9MARC
MAKKDAQLYFEDLVNIIRTKFPVQGVWFITLNVKDAALVLWKHKTPDPISLGILLKTITNTSKVLKVLAMKDGGGFVRLILDPKFLDRQISKTALGPGLMSAERGQEREIARDVKASHKHEAERLAVAKAKFFPKEKGSQSKSSMDKDSLSSKDKGKSVVQEAPKKKPSVPTQGPKEKLLGSSIAAETAWLSSESKSDSNKRKRDHRLHQLRLRRPLLRSPLKATTLEVVILTRISLTPPTLAPNPLHHRSR